MLRFIFHILPASHIEHLLLNQRMNLLWNRAQKPKTATNLSPVQSSLYHFSMGKARVFLCSSNRSWSGHKNQWSIPYIAFFQEPQNPQVLVLSFMLLWFGPISVLLCLLSLAIPGWDPHFSFPITSHIIFAPQGRMDSNWDKHCCHLVPLLFLLVSDDSLGCPVPSFFSFQTCFPSYCLQCSMWLLSIWKSQKNGSVVTVSGRKVFWAI